MGNGSELITLAKEKFGSLAEAEEKLFWAVAKGEVADYSAYDEKENEPTTATKWSPKRILRADLIAWLCMNEHASTMVTPKGIDIRSARIDQEINLSFMTVSFPLLFKRCSTPDGIVLYKTDILSLNLSGTYTGSVSMVGTTVRVDVLLSDGFKAEGGMRLRDTTIGGDLRCHKGLFLNPGAYALLMVNVYVEGSVFLNDGFKAEGRVDLHKSEIARNLECGSGQFINKGVYALSTDSMKVKGDVNLGKGFKAEGGVDLRDTTIGGDLRCSNGLFLNPGAYALLILNANVEGSVFLNDGFKAEGRVDLHKSEIARNLECGSGQFTNEGVYALSLSADSMKVKGHVYLDGGFKAEGGVCLTDAIIKGNLYCYRGKFSNPRGDALLADKLNVDGDVHFEDSDFSDDGTVCLKSAVIGRIFIRQVYYSGKFTLDLRSAKVHTLCDDPKSWPERGHLMLNGFSYDEIHDSAPMDVESRLDWLRRQDPFSSQPYDQFARVFEKTMGEGTAIDILVAKNRDRARSTKMSGFLRLWYYIFGGQ